jgi:4-amino-4-deoxy-L-arabinose transferase-like glycosyltransferase
MFKTYFSDNQLIFLLSGLTCFLVSLFFHLKEKEKLSIIFLILTALSIYCFAALLDPFLNIYDERFHALVAKNLLHHPLKPTLYDDPVVNMHYDKWDKYHIWLHKQPLFLWQIAASFRLFGVSEFTLRLPSVILGVVLVFIGYRSGKLLVNARTGFLTGILFITSSFILELIAGRQMVDHNDFSFLAYVSLSIWAFIEYHYSTNKKWIYLIGLFSGFAILCKWLPGVLVYSGWFVYMLNGRKLKFNHLKDMLISSLITLIIALPWQIYTFIYYPAEAKLAYEINVRHISESVEGHSGTFWYHFGQFDTLYGSITSFLILPAFFILYKKITDKKMYLPLMTMIVIVYLFFSLVKTKMPAFPLIVALLIFISLAAILDYLLSYISTLRIKQWIKKLIICLAILLLVFARFNTDRIQAVHTQWKKSNLYSRMLSYNKNIFRSLELPDNAVIFNLKGQHYIESMFYTGLPSYNFVPTNDQYLDLKRKGRIVAIFKPVNSELPDYLINDQTTIVIDEVLQGYN